MKTFKIYTLGCKVNQYESQAIRETLESNGLAESKKDFANLYVINTCTVTNQADKKSLYFINRAFSNNPKARIIATGCLTEQDKEKILAKNKNIQIVKNSDKQNIGRGGSRTAPTSFGISDFKGHTRAFLKIQDGCDNFCSYCKVPLVRGRPKSRKLSRIIEEAKRLARKGFKEIVLTGICLGAYGQDLSPRLNLTNVLISLSKIENICRLRLSSIEAGDIDEKLIDLIKNSKFICKHLHLPLQSGDDEILKKMNRRFLTAEYLKLIRRLKKEIPQLSITTDIIVGFPSEKEQNFKNTVNFLKKIKPSRMHIFSYSQRRGTKAAEIYPKIPEEIIKKRFHILAQLADRFSYEYRKKFLDKKLEVLVENSLDKYSRLQTGYTDNYIKVLINSKENLSARLVNVRINRLEKENTYAQYAD